MALATGRTAVFLDKDGTLLDNIPYNIDPALVRFARGADECLRALHEAGYVLIVVTNQSGVARGLFPETALAGVEDEIAARMRAMGAPLEGFYYCPHPAYEDLAGAAPCACRKPAPGMLQRAAMEHGLTLARSWLVGDIMDDCEAGRRAGCRTVLVRPDDQPSEPSPWPAPTYIARDLAEAARLILWQDGHATAPSQGRLEVRA